MGFLKLIGAVSAAEHKSALADVQADADRHKRCFDGAVIERDEFEAKFKLAISDLAARSDEIAALKDRINSVYGVDNWKGQGYETREAEINDMAEVGRSLMERVASVTEMGGEMEGWHPMDNPAEIVTDMANAIYEQRAEIASLRPDAEKWRDRAARELQRGQAKRDAAGKAVAAKGRASK